MKYLILLIIIIIVVLIIRKNNLKENLFKLRIMPFIYDNGWRYVFRFYGYPGYKTEIINAHRWFMYNKKDNNSLLDIGCGTCKSTNIFIKTNEYKKIFAFDNSQSMIDRCIKNKIKSPNSDVLYKKVSIYNILLPDNNVDFIFCGASLHCFDNINKALKELLRVLKVGGKLRLTTFMNMPFFATIFISFRNKENLRNLFLKAGYNLKYLKITNKNSLYTEISYIKQ